MKQLNLKVRHKDVKKRAPRLRLKTLPIASTLEGTSTTTGTSNSVKTILGVQKLSQEKVNIADKAELQDKSLNDEGRQDENLDNFHDENSADMSGTFGFSTGGCSLRSECIRA